MIWPDWLIAEIETYRRSHDWGGFLWEETKPVEMTLERKKKWHQAGAGTRTRAEMNAETEYVLGEVEWFLEANVHPLMIAQQLHKDPRTIYKLAERHKRPAIKASFANYAGSRAA